MIAAFYSVREVFQKVIMTASIDAGVTMVAALQSE
jgi:hypothetical protein